MHQMLGREGSSAPIADEGMERGQRVNEPAVPWVPRKSALWPESVRIAVLVARGQGMSCPDIARSLSELTGHHVDEGSIRYACHRFGIAKKRLAPWTPPEGYRDEYKRLQGILGTVKARQEIELLVVRDRRRAA